MFEDSNDEYKIKDGLMNLETNSIFDYIEAFKKDRLKQIQEESDKKIQPKEEKIFALRELESKLLELKIAANPLINKPGFQEERIFESRLASIDQTSYVDIQYFENVDVGYYTLSDIVIAKPKRQYVSGFSSDKISVVSETQIENNFKSGSFIINNQTITLQSGDTLRNIEYKINHFSLNSKVSAKILRTSPKNYTFILESSLPGLVNAYEIKDFDGIFDNNANINWKISNANDASFVFNEFNAVNQDNDVKDLINGMSFKLLKDTPENLKINLLISLNSQMIYTKINDFAQSYNNVMIFLKNNTRRANPEIKNTKDGPLVSEGLEFLYSTLFQKMTNKVEVYGKSFLTWNAIGAKFIEFKDTQNGYDVKNLITFSQEELLNKINNNFDDVRSFFSLDSYSSNYNFMIYKVSNELAINEFNLTVDETKGLTSDIATITYFDNDLVKIIKPNFELRKSNLTSSIITGTKDSVIEGLEIFYSGSGQDSTKIIIHQGVASRVNNLVDKYINDKDGLIKEQIKSISDKKATELKELNQKELKLKEEIDRKQKIAINQQRQIDKYQDTMRYIKSLGRERDK